MGILHDIFSGTPPKAFRTDIGAKLATPEQLPVLPSDYKPRFLDTMRQGDDRRPCWVRGKKAMFHCWVNAAHPVPPRNVPVEQIDEKTRYFQFRSTTALVEFEDGTCARVYPNEVQFADGGGFADRAWFPMAEGGRKMAQSKPDLISRQELLTLIHDHAEAIKDDSPLQYAILAYWTTVVEALPAKAVVEVVRCAECRFFEKEFDNVGICKYAGINLDHADYGFCSYGERRTDHGKD